MTSVNAPNHVVTVVRRVVAVSAVALLLAAVPSGAGDEVTFPRRGAQVETLPVVPVRITNESDAMLSLSVTSAACTPRLFLPPRSSITIADCLRWGVVHQAVAVFYDQTVVQERQFRLLLVAPGHDWTFRHRSASDPSAAPKVQP